MKFNFKLKIKPILTLWTLFLSAAPLISHAFFIGENSITHYYYIESIDEVEFKIRTNTSEQECHYKNAIAWWREDESKLICRGGQEPYMYIKVGSNPYELMRVDLTNVGDRKGYCHKLTKIKCQAKLDALYNAWDEALKNSEEGTMIRFDRLVFGLGGIFIGEWETETFQYPDIIDEISFEGRDGERRYFYQIYIDRLLRQIEEERAEEDRQREERKRERERQRREREIERERAYQNYLDNNSFLQNNGNHFFPSYGD